MHPIYDHSKSREQYRRAAKVIPSGVYGHLGPAEGCFIPVSAYPQFSEKAKGPYFWDIWATTIPTWTRPRQSSGRRGTASPLPPP